MNCKECGHPKYKHSRKGCCDFSGGVLCLCIQSMEISRTRKAGKHDEKIARFVDEFWRKNYYPPAIRDVMVSCGMGSSALVHYVYRKIEKSGEYVVKSGKLIPVWIANYIDSTKAVRCDGGEGDDQ